MEGELILVSIITTIGMLVGMQMIQYNWTKRQELKLHFERDRIRLKQKAGIAPKQIQSEMKEQSGIASMLLNAVKDNPELISEFLGQAEGVPQDTDDIGSMIINFAKDNPELVKGFLDGLNKKGGGANEFKSQI